MTFGQHPASFSQIEVDKTHMRLFCHKSSKYLPQIISTEQKIIIINGFRRYFSWSVNAKLAFVEVARIGTGALFIQIKATLDSLDIQPQNRQRVVYFHDVSFLRCACF